jgi:hypothetical protein
MPLGNNLTGVASNAISKTIFADVVTSSFGPQECVYQSSQSKSNTMQTRKDGVMMFVSDSRVHKDSRLRGFH